MSAKKTRRISEDRYQHLTRIADRMADVRRDMPRLLDGVLNQARSDLEAAMRTVDQRHRRFEQDIETLSERAAAFERNTSARLAEQQRRMDGGRADLETAIAREQEIRELQVAALQTEIDELNEAHDSERQLAEAWLADATTLRDAIVRRLPHERFAPGELARVDAELATAAATLATGRSAGSVIALAQTGFHQLTEIRGRVELREHQWRQVQAQARERLLTVRAIAEQSRSRPGVNEDGEEVRGVTIDVDALTDGALEAAQARITAWLAEVEDERTTLDRLRTAVDEASTIESEVTDAVKAAIVAHLAAQARAETATSVVRTLQAQGYGKAREQTYRHGDMRGALLAKLRHPDGSEIVVEVAPSPAPSPLVAPGQDVTLHSFDVDVTSAETRDRRMGQIARELQKDGIAFEPGQRTREDPDRGVLDFRGLRRRRVEDEQMPEQA